MTAPAVETRPATSVWSMYRAIVGIGLACALLIVAVFQGTADRIRQNQAEALKKALAEVLPQATSVLAVVDDGGSLVPREGADLPVFLGYDENGRLIGAAITGIGMGYQDNIRVLYAYSFAEEAITGFKVLESKETPGLGDKIEVEPHFVANFEALDVRLNPDGSALANALVTVGEGEKQSPWELDGITGATITSVAIGDILNGSAQQWVPLLNRYRDQYAMRPEAPPASEEGS
ncbi:MAG: FMN-binding protein [Xanthomonadales bacterium]|nr:FMN-binding protein [Xanthomonadales bacterium]